MFINEHLKYLIMIFFLIFSSCEMQSVVKNSDVKINSKANIEKVDSAQTKNLNNIESESKRFIKVNPYDIENSPGLIRIEDDFYENNKTIRIYNQDGSVWYEFKASDYVNKDHKVVYPNENFKPFRYGFHESWVYFKCVGDDKTYFHIIVNEGTGLKKYVRKDESLFRFVSWEQYILDCFAIKFGQENPLRKNPKGQLIIEDIENNITFHAEEIVGEWIKVRWYEKNNNNNLSKFGWVKWKNKNKIVVQLFETA